MPRGARDLAAEPMFEYGSRVGFWRLKRLFDERELPFTLFACALALDHAARFAVLVWPIEFTTTSWLTSGRPRRPSVMWPSPSGGMRNDWA